MNTVRNVIEISGTPIAKPRPRGARTNSGKIIFYTPTKGKRFENQVRERAEKLYASPCTSPMAITVTFLMPRPQRLVWKTREMPREPAPHRPDIDNLFKAILDGLNGVAYLDDGQVTAVQMSKKYHAGDEGPKTIIIIEEDRDK